jgi:hypothetical protein
MTNFKQLFAIPDKLGVTGFLGMWVSFFTTSFVVLLADDTTGPARNFCAASQLLCCTNLASLGYAAVKNVRWSEASFYSMNFDTFGTWVAFAYYGGGDVLGSSALGVWNTVQIVGTALNTVAGVASLYLVAKDPAGFKEYTDGENEC